MNRKRLYLMIAPPGAGKSTYVNSLVEDLGVQVVCPDDIRLSFGHVFWGPLEPLVHALTYQMARSMMARGLDVVIDECHTRAEYVRRWKHAAEEFDYEVVGVYLTTPLETCIERRDDGQFPIDVIPRKAQQLEQDLPKIKSLLDIYLEV